MSRSCPACDGTNFAPLLSGATHRYVENGTSKTWEYDVIQCRTCGLGMVAPEPSLALIQTFYPSEYGPYAADASNSAAQTASSLKNRFARWRFAAWRHNGPRARAQEILGRMVELGSGKTVSYSLGLPLQLAQDAAIFELGFGSGNWLRIMAALGYTRLSGYDIGANAQNLVELSRSGVDVTTGDFLANSYPRRHFDCIRLEHVFEHLLNPMRVLEQCRDMLRPAGVLVMTLPCVDSLSNRLSLRHSPNGVEIPRHLYHHTPDSAARMLRRANFRNVRVRAYGDVASLVATLNGLLAERGLPTIHGRAAWVASPLYRMTCEALGKGELMTAVAEA